MPESLVKAVLNASNSLKSVLLARHSSSQQVSETFVTSPGKLCIRWLLHGTTLCHVGLETEKSTQSIWLPDTKSIEKNRREMLWHVSKIDRT